ncbi:hypothetical protein AB0I77_04875 [Streptomyces sp. NPDC050619]|uniref:hypothetical protein n=1 Tax=Streptomyces sp. NPDC050619 TaxID=3157214 RepID=UPI00341D9A89
MPDHDTYQHLNSLLDTSSVDYRLIDHDSGGMTDKVCALRTPRVRGREVHRLDRSLCISGADYARVAQPRVETIATPASAA